MYVENGRGHNQFRERTESFNSSEEYEVKKKFTKDKKRLENENKNYSSNVQKSEVIEYKE